MIKLFRRKQAELPTTEYVGTPVADSLEFLAETMYDCSQSIRKCEPLSLEILRDHGRAVMVANSDAVSVMGALMRRLSQ